MLFNFFCDLYLVLFIYFFPFISFKLLILYVVFFKFLLIKLSLIVIFPLLSLNIDFFVPNFQRVSLMIDLT